MGKRTGMFAKNEIYSQSTIHNIFFFSSTYQNIRLFSFPPVSQHSIEIPHSSISDL